MSGLWSKALAAALAPRNSSQGHPRWGGGGHPREGHWTQRAIYGAGGEKKQPVWEQSGVREERAWGQAAARFLSLGARYSSVDFARRSPARATATSAAWWMQRGTARGTGWKACHSPVLLHITASSTVWAVGTSPPLHRDIWVPDALRHQAPACTGARGQPAQRPRGAAKWPRAGPVRSPSTARQAVSPETAD